MYTITLIDIMSGYMKLPTNNPDTRNNINDSDIDVSREVSDQEDCASFADNEDNQDSPLIGMILIGTFT